MLFLGKVTRYAIFVQGMPSSPHDNAVWQSSMAKRLAMQDRAVNAPVAFGQQIKVATNAQVCNLICMSLLAWAAVDEHHAG